MYNILSLWDHVGTVDWHTLFWNVFGRVENSLVHNNRSCSEVNKKQANPVLCDFEDHRPFALSLGFHYQHLHLLIPLYYTAYVSKMSLFSD